MKAVAPSLCFLAGASLTSSLLAPSIPVTSRSNASPRRASQRDTVVASGEHFETLVRLGRQVAWDANSSVICKLGRHGFDRATDISYVYP